MKKYKYQCDNNKCNHQFIDDNPSCCPKCKTDDFTILEQVNTYYADGYIAHNSHYRVGTKVPEHLMPRERHLLKEDINPCPCPGGGMSELCCPKTELFSTVIFKGIFEALILGSRILNLPI